MKPAIFRPCTAVSAILPVLIWLAFASGTRANPPGWWAKSGATDVNPPNDFAVANQGQLKHFTSRAIDELNARIPGGAGQDLNNMRNGWVQEYRTGGFNAANPLPADFTAMNSGQLKWIAVKVHNRLVFAKYEDSLPPWLVPNPATDSQLVNLGQLKTVFAFDLTTSSRLLSAWWQRFYFDNQTGIDPTADPDNDGLSNLQEFDIGTNPLNPDTDGDHVTDGDEVHFSFTNPLFAIDLDGDGLPDDWEKSYSIQMLSMGAPSEYWGANGNSLQSGDLLPSAILQSEGMTVQEIYDVSSIDTFHILLNDLFVQAKRAEFTFRVSGSSLDFFEDGEETINDAGGYFGDGSGGYGWGTIECWSRLTLTTHDFDVVSYDPISFAPAPSLEWFNNESLHATWTYYSSWDSQWHDGYNPLLPQPATLLTLDEISYGGYMGLSFAGSSLYAHGEKSYEYFDASVNHTEFNGTKLMSQFRLFRPRPTKDPVNQYFLKVMNEWQMVDINTEGANIVLQGTSESRAKTVEVIKLTIPAFGNTSQWVDTTPATADQKYRTVELLPIQVVELSPTVKDEDGDVIVGSDKPRSEKPLTPFVELNPVADRIAHRELKVRIGEALKSKKITWTLEPVPGATPSTIRGAWTNSTTHPNRFEASTAFGLNNFTLISQASGQTTVADDGFTAIRVNVPPIGFNQVRIKIQIEGVSMPVDLIDMEVPGVVVIDPGHGGDHNVAGSNSNNATSPSGMLEKNMALDYGLALRGSLQTKRLHDKLNIRVFMTRVIDANPTGAERANVARDNGADVLFVLHFNTDDDEGTKAHPRVAHQSRGTLEVYRTTNNVFPQEDAELSSQLIDRIVGTLMHSDSGANHRARVAYGGDGVSGPAVSSDLYNGNSAKYHPVRTAYIEGEFIDIGANTAADPTDDTVDILLNTGPNAANLKIETVNAIRDGIIQDIRDQPHQSP